MRRFCVVTMQGEKKILPEAEKIKTYLENRDCFCFINPGYVKKENIPKDTECVIVLGGDGTLLQAARELVGRSIRFIGINFGHLGFLAEEKDDIPALLERLITNQFFVEKRMLLRGQIIRNGKSVMENVALNDIVINRSSLMRVMQLKVLVNGMLLGKYDADGIIIATPTGSTAYSMSAGGPIVEPSANLIVMTPICPHTLNTRSIVFDGEDVIEIQASSRKNYDNDIKRVFFDGNDNIVLEDGDRVLIERSRLSADLIQLKSRSFLEILGKKMGAHEGTEA